MNSWLVRFLFLCLAIGIMAGGCGYTTQWYSPVRARTTMADGEAYFLVWWGDFDKERGEYIGMWTAVLCNESNDSLLVFAIVYNQRDDRGLCLDCFDIVDVAWSTEGHEVVTDIDRLRDTTYTCADCWDFKGPRREFNFGPIRIPERKPKRIYVSFDVVIYDTSGQEVVERKRMVVPIEYHRKSALKDFLDGR